MYFCYVHCLWKCQLRNPFHSGDTFQYIFCMLLKENLWILLLRYVWVWFYPYICYWCFPKDFGIIRVITIVCDSYIKETVLLVFIFEFSRVLYRWILTVQDVKANDCSPLLNLAWLSSTNLLKVFGANLSVRACVIDMCSILWRMCSILWR